MSDVAKNTMNLSKLEFHVIKSYKHKGVGVEMPANTNGREPGFNGTRDKLHHH